MGEGGGEGDFKIYKSASAFASARTEGQCGGIAGESDLSNLRDLLQEGRSLLRGVAAAPAIEAKVLLLHATGLGEVEFLASPWTVVQPKNELKYRRLLQKRLSGVPLAYIVGRKEFWSLSLRVGPGVLIPRPETELLVEKTLDLVASPRVTIVDIGTGSGNIALALARELPKARIVATDASARALRIARLNAQDNQLDNVTFLRGNLFAPLLGVRLDAACDFIVSNPPYVSASDWDSLPPEIREHEPRRALLGGKTGLDIIRRLVRGAPAFLKLGGCLLFEVGYDQAATSVSFLGEPWTEVETFADLRGIRRVVKACHARHPNA
jgi:release factor glutamine methyltransferase